MGARLFTATDVERAARLAARRAATDNDPTVIEAATTAAVAAVTDESPLFYSEHEVRSMLQYTLSKEDVDAELTEALAAIGR